MTSRAIARLGALTVALLLGVGMLAAAPAGAASSFRYGPPRLIDTTHIVGFPQHFALTPGQLARGFGGGGGGGFGAPTVTLNPVSQTVASGAPVTFSAAASGSPTPSVQWKESTNNGASFSSISRATSTSYSFTASSSENGYKFEATFSSFGGSATTSAATLTVGAASTSPPVITANPSSESVVSGTAASFSAAATGSPTPTVQWQVSTGGAFSNISAATSTTYSFTASTSENGYRYQAVFSNSSNTATTTIATLTVTAATPPATAPEQSSNWSGYADVGTTFSAVNASWTVPTITCTSGQTAYSAHWIGIDGFSSSTVEQDGTEADCINGSPTYDAWYEMYGDNAVDSGYEVELSSSSNPVSHGDSMSASVSVSGNEWTLSVIDSTKGWSFSTPAISFSAAQSSAEWVVERPEVCSRSCSLTSLADFGTVTFSGASATAGSVGSIGSYSNDAIEMVNGSTVLAVPSGLSGSGFSDTWKAA